ncbi:MAG: alpha/beta fold hydrolase [Geminicoccaceae bacterium]
MPTSPADASEDASRQRGPRPLALYLARAGAGGDASRFAAFVDGLKAYWRHPRIGPPAPRAELWRAGSARLLDCGGAGGLPVLMVPSLVNRAYVLDLMPGRSLAEALAQGGLRPLLLDWGAPDTAERHFDIARYVDERLMPALRLCATLDPRPPVLLGYCMGGLLALAAASRKVRLGGIALLATPWDFVAARSLQPLPTPLAVGGLVATTTSLGEVPVSLLDWGFGLMDPDRVVARFAAFATLAPGSDEARGFIAVEDWLGDGVPLAGPVARECVEDWYGANQPARGRWRVAGTPVRPERLELPAFVALPRADQIVPHASAAPLARLLANATVVEPPCGHVGMVAGRRATVHLWQPLVAWLRRIALGQL